MDVISLYFIASYYYSCRCRNLPLPLDFPFLPLSLGYPFAAAVAVSLTPSTATTVDALRSVLLSRASLFLLSLYLSLLLVRAFSLFLSLHVEGIHSRNSLLRGLFCCNRCCPPPVPARSFRFFCTAPLPPFFLPSVVLSFSDCCFSQPDTSFASHARTVEDARPRHVDRRSYRPFSYII